MKRERFKYQPSGEGWIVRPFKHRAKGEVRFEIFKAYKPYLEKYLSFVNHYFPDSEWLFPGMSCKREKWGEVHVQGQLVAARKLIQRYGVPWIPPRVLRKTKANWFLRRSGDKDQTAEAMQTTRKVLGSSYEEPSQQRAMVEVTRFWKKTDPIAKGDLKASVIPAGPCGAKPKAASDKPVGVVEPNCINPAGCLWCVNYRDVDSFDYVWSLACFRYLKTIEAAGIPLSAEAPIDLVVDRLAEKINWFARSDKHRAKWVTEAQERVEEGDYHPSWRPLIEFLEVAE